MTSKVVSRRDKCIAPRSAYADSGRHSKFSQGRHARFFAAKVRLAPHVRRPIQAALAPRPSKTALLRMFDEAQARDVNVTNGVDMHVRGFRERTARKRFRHCLTPYPGTGCMMSPWTPRLQELPRAGHSLRVLRQQSARRCAVSCR
jgi:hypothetical protein